MFDQSNNTGAIDVKKDGSVLEKKIKMQGLTLLAKLDWALTIISIAKTVPQKIGTLFRSIKFLSPEVANTAIHGILLSCIGWCSLLPLVTVG